MVESAAVAARLKALGWHSVHSVPKNGQPFMALFEGSWGLRTFHDPVFYRDGILYNANFPGITIQSQVAAWRPVDSDRGDNTPCTN